jgi:dienelactone hydrolase
VSRNASARAPAGVSRHGRASGRGRATRRGRRTGARGWPRAALTAVVVAVLAGGAFVVARAAAGGSPRKSPGSAAAAGSPSPSRRPSPPRRLPVGKIGSYAVAVRSLVLVDTSREQTAGRRVLPALVRYPVIPARAAAAGGLARGLFPLVVFAPGYLQCGGIYRALLHTWASAGYVVAAVEFPRTSCHVASPDEADLANQPGDVSFVIRRLLAISGRRHGVLSGLVNPAAIAVAGHSDGGDTVAAVAANTCCLDRKVSAAVVLAGAEWPPLHGSYFARTTPPILFVQGDADNINLPSDSQLMYRADTRGPRFYLDLFGASHLSPYAGQGPPEPVVAQVTTDFLNRYLAGQPAAAAAMRRAGNRPGTALLVHGNKQPP